MGYFDSFELPAGIPIEEETHEKYSPELKAAWATFDEWWQSARSEAETRMGRVEQSSMPENVREAYDLICKTPIPGYDVATGADSCYMVAVSALMAP